MAWNEQATKAFMAKPLSFMANAMILPPIFTKADLRNRAQPLVLTNATPVSPSRIKSSDRERTCPTYQISKAKDGEQGFMSYIADYDQGLTVHTTLGTEANFCFTVNMNGCTFGMGSQSSINPGVCVVSHGNAANTGTVVNFDSSRQGPKGSTAIQTSIQYSRAKEIHGPDGVVFEPEHYRTDGKMSVTFCHRTPPGLWKLYYLSYTRSGGAYTHYGVQEAPTNSLSS